MNRFLLVVVSILLLSNLQLAAQGTAINTSGTGPDSSAMLDVTSTSKGLLIPRMTQVQRLAISNPAEGLTVFQTDDGCFYYFRNGLWWRMCGVPDCTGFNFSVVAGITGPNPVSVGSTINLTSTQTGGINPITYSWTGPSGYSSTTQNPSIAGALPAMSGNYAVTATEGRGCTASSTINIGVCGTTVIAGSNSVVMVGSTLNLTAAASNGTAPYNFSWTGPAGFTSTQQNPAIGNAQSINAGSYIVTVTDAGNCIAKDTTVVIITTCVTNDSVVFNYNGGQQSWTVPAGICNNVTFRVWGAQGSNGGGNGGYAQAQTSVTAGQVYYVFVGGQAGYNGGGVGATNRNGGGASDIRFGGSSLNDRIIVAGGGGALGGANAGSGGIGGGGTSCSNGAGGGEGSCQGCNPYGGPGTPGTCTSGGSAGTSSGGFTGGGGGGGLTSGGAGSSGGGYGGAGTTGTLGTGGNRGVNGSYNCNSGAGGGGGYYGGGGTGDGQCAAGGGGGGSSWASSSLINMVFAGGARSGDGKIVIKW
ncbi:MAG: hypothetical protein WCM76_09645 [Bacteroidota bacterium]